MAVRGATVITVPSPAPQGPRAYCPSCHRSYPRVRGWQADAPIQVLMLHRGVRAPRRPSRKDGLPSVCKTSLREWGGLDARPVDLVGTPLPPVPPALIDRRTWLEHFLGSVPSEFGGPMLDQLNAFAPRWRDELA